ncbi:hypothetical protein ABEB36_004204 [Hypothenemus hampei]|uniref:PHD-type domain-containing protein n=1 Tax=Hypothenemus hampei TaxID=57062 RepID=A0ABD1F2W2_HYPHA
MQNAANGFSKTGIFPFNKDVFPDHLVIPSEITDNINLESEQEGESSKTKTGLTTDLNGNVVQTAVHDTYIQIEAEDAKTSADEENGIDKNVISKNQKYFSIKPSDIVPLPQAEKKSTIRKRKKGTFGILNTSPEIEVLKKKAAQKTAREFRKAAKICSKLDESSGDEEQIVNVHNDDDDAYCIYCNSLFKESKPGEYWIRCTTCRKWAHCLCADVSPKVKVFVCDICIP